MNRPTTKNALVSVVLPLLNEEAILRKLVAEITFELDQSGCNWQVVLVNDGSTDRSPVIIDELADSDRRISTIHLSRNFGHQAAVAAGIEHAIGDAVILMDSDGQDDPKAIPRLIEGWLDGNDVVNAVRSSRTEGTLKRFLFSGFYWLLARLSSTPIQRDAGNFGIFDAVIARQIKDMPERDRYFPGMRAWVGYRQSSISVDRLPRYDGQSRVRMRGLIALAKTALFGFSSVPLLAFYWLAALAATVSCACIAFAVFHKICTGLAIPGWASITSMTAFFGAINALGIAILGEYIIRIYDQVRGRPTFIVSRSVNAATESLDSSLPPMSELRLLEEINRLQVDLNNANSASKIRRAAFTEQVYVGSR